MVKRPKTTHKAFRDLQDAWHELVFEVRKALHLDDLLDWLTPHADALLNYLETYRLEVTALAFWLGFMGVIVWVAWVW